MSTVRVSRHSFLCALTLLVFVALPFGCSQPAGPPAAPVQPATSAVSASTVSPFAGSYTQTRLGVGHPRGTQRLTLRLEPDWACTLTTEFVGTRHKPTVETGAWRVDRDHLTVVLTRAAGQPERTEIVFVLRDRRLVATKFDPMLFGKTGLTLEKQ